MFGWDAVMLGRVCALIRTPSHKPEVHRAEADALIVAAVGLYSVLAFDVAQRTRELGIRTALGARRVRLLGSVLWHGLRLAAIGIAAGLAITYLAAPYIQDLLFEVSPRDPGVLTAVTLTLLAVSLAASLAPGLRATRVDPVAALRAD